MREQQILDLLIKNDGAMYKSAILKELCQTESQEEERKLNRKILSLVNKAKVDYKTVYNTEVVYLTERNLQ